MLILQISRMKPELTAEEKQELYVKCRQFYDAIPPGVTIHGDYSATDHSVSYTILECATPELVDEINAPFAHLVDVEHIELVETDDFRRKRLLEATGGMLG